MATSTCERCNSTFTYPGNRPRRFCGKACEMNDRKERSERTREKSKRNCEWCGVEFYPPKTYMKNRFCGRSCSAQWRHANIPNSEKQREAARKNIVVARAAAMDSPGLAAYLHSDRNPFNDPAVRQKSIDANRAKGYTHLSGGNGTGLSPAEQLLHDASGWKPHIVSTGTHGQGIPTHYKLDLAHPAAKVSVEADGKSHLMNKVAEADARKTAWLTSRGWVVIRFTNEQVFASVGACTAEMKRVAESRLAAAVPEVTQ